MARSTKRTAFAAIVVCAALAPSQHAVAEIFIAESMRSQLIDHADTVAAGGRLQWDIPFNRNDVIEVSVQLPPDSVPGIGAFICPQAEYLKFTKGLTPQNCNGIQRGEFALSFSYTVPYSGAYVLFIDNSFSIFSAKTPTVRVIATQTVPQETRAWLHTFMGGMMQGMHEAFVFPDFNITVAPCGMENAFSDGRNGDITFCSELLFRLINSEQTGALTAVLLHEFGHSLLNLWGEPSWRNEQAVDEFSTVLLLAFGQKTATEEAIAFFAGSDPVAEAIRAQSQNSPHPLSVQRMRNIGDIVDNPHDYLRRWTKVLYEHATDAGLQSEIDAPTEFSDPQLAAATLRARRVGAVRAEAAEPTPVAFDTPMRSKTPSCREEIGVDRAARLVERCVNVSPATRPPCNAANSCELIQGEIDRACGISGQAEKTPLECRGW